MKILITGATGFIGQHVTSRLLDTNAEIAILTRSSGNIKNFDVAKIKIIEGSLESLSECSEAIKSFNPTICIHLAWLGIPDYSYEVSKKNLNLSMALIDLLLDKTNCSKFIVSGSCFEYGKTLGRLAETTNEENISAIAWAKNSLKNYLSLRCNEKGLNWVWLRIFYAYGPGQRINSLIPSLFRAIRSGQAPAIQNPNNANDFIHISDVSEAFATACNKTVESGVYNIGSGYLSRVADIWSLVQQYSQSQDKNICTNTSTEQTQKNNPTAVGGYANIEKPKMKLLWEPKIPLEKGIQQFIGYLSEQEKV